MGVLDKDSSLQQGVLGRHGKSERNLVGHDLLEFCAINSLSYNEHLVSGERNASVYLDPSCYQEVSY